MSVVAPAVPALELKQVRAGYGPVEVLHGIDLVVAAGSVVALLGPNGAGKTTLLRSVAGLLPLRSGSVHLGSANHVRGTARRARGGLCLIPEGRGVFPRLTVAENVALFVRGGGVGEAIAVAAEAFPVLGRRLEQRAGTLSGGEQQMLAVSRALVTEPAIVLADELSLGLGPAIVDEIFDAVAGLRARGAAVLVVEQYVERALEVADYVYVLHKGEVVLLDEAVRCSDADLTARYLGGPS